VTAPALIFDLDGTLIDSAPAIHAVSNAVLTARGFPALSQDEVRSFVGKGVPHLVRCLLQRHGPGPGRAAVRARPRRPDRPL
jgi:phosphoglycolate phosphatase